MATSTPEVRAAGEQDQQAETIDPSVCECGGDIISEGSERVCQDCGLVDDEDRIDHGPDWRLSDNNRNRSRARAGTLVDPTRNDLGFDTQIGFEDGRKTSHHRRLLRAKRFEKLGEDGKYREQGKLLSDIKRAACSLELPQPVSDNACVLFKQFHNSGDHSGYGLDEMGAAVIYAAARCGKAPIQPGDVCEQFGVDRQRLFDEVSRLRRAIGVPIPIETPSMLVTQFVDELDGEVRTQSLARQLAAEVEQADFASSGRSPSAMAAAVVYEAFFAASWEQKRSQKEVGKVADVSPMTIRRNRSSMKEAGINGDPTALVE